MYLRTFRLSRERGSLETYTNPSALTNAHCDMLSYFGNTAYYGVGAAGRTQTLQDLEVESAPPELGLITATLNPKA